MECKVNKSKSDYTWTHRPYSYQITSLEQHLLSWDRSVWT